MLFPVRETSLYSNAKCHFKFRKKTISKQNNVSCHHKTVPKPKPLACLLFSECSLVLFTICISKPVGSRFGQVKFRTGKFSPGIAFTIILYKSVPFTKKWLRKPETGIKDGFEEMQHELPLRTFCPEKQEKLSRCSVAPRNFPLERPK